MPYKVLLEHYPYRYIIMDTLLPNGFPDYRMQKFYKNDGWNDEYLFDNQLQMTTAMEDYDYSCWLANDPSYKKDSVQNPYPNK
jgi:hypothetical protein